MSWFTDLADKAETLLNKIDQNAAAVLQEKDKIIQNGTSLKSIENSNPIIADNFKDTSQSNKNGSIERINVNKPSYQEESLPFDKLKNIKSASKKFLSPAKKNNNIESNGASTSKAIMQVQNFPSDAELLTMHTNTPLINWTYDGDSGYEGSTRSSQSKLENSSNELDSLSHASSEIDTSQNKNDKFIDIENEMLKNEISVVNNELSILLTKAKSAERATEDSQVRLIEMEKLYMQVMKDNDILRQKVSEYQNELAARGKGSLSYEDEEIKLIENENESLKERVKQLEISVLSITSLKNDIENDLKFSQNKCLELEEKLEKARIETANTLVEWKNYKIRANNTLSMKEKIIEELGGNQENNETDTINSLSAQINQIKLERNNVAEELTHLQSEYEYKIKEIDQLEINLRSTERQVSTLREALRQEKSAREISEHTVNSLGKEMKTMQMETSKQISTLRAKLQENRPREGEKQYCELNSSFSAESGEERVRSLTQALVAKQAALESVTADRNALRLQLEKTENKYRSDLVSMKNNQPRIINVNDTDDAKARFPSLLGESPWDSGLSRRVKKAYSSLDSCSVRIGVFLRRNPIARIFIISYMIILHLWVLVVLCTYTPEAHPK